MGRYQSFSFEANKIWQRVNIANANVFNLSSDLKLTGNEYNTALVIFFVPYILFEIPSNIFLKKFRPRFWLSACMFLFGLASICQGLVKNYSGLLATRFFLGLFESGMFPGCKIEPCA
jgi:MFS family permease